MMEDNVKFWILGDDGEKYGPISLAELQEWLVEGRVGPDSQAALDEDGKPAERWQRLDLYSQTVALWKESQKRVLVLAPLWRRVAAGLIDIVFIFALLGMALTLVLSKFMGLDAMQIQKFSEVILQASSSLNLSDDIESIVWMVNILAYAIMIIYFGYFHFRYAGRTLGMVICGLKVMSEEGDPIRAMQGVLRAAGLIVTISFYGLGFLLALFTSRRQALQDLVSRTIVVENRVEK
jgi:uncharacterized RDD family membrane protein YckC